MAKSKGQKAYEGYWKAQQLYCEPWEEQSTRKKHAWEAAAVAALDTSDDPPPQKPSGDGGGPGQ
jgi:hypothetical protein